MRRLLFSLALIAAVPIAITATPPSALASSSNLPANVTYTSSTMNLQKVGTVNLGDATAPVSTAAPVNTAGALAGSPSAERFGAPPVDFATGGFAAASAINAPGAVATGNAFSVQRDRQVNGFEGISGPQQASVNSGDLEPPDQGTCAGPSDANGTVTVEIINNALSVYTPSGTQLLPVTSTTTLFDQPSTAFLSDPRCYFDVQTQRWFFTELSITSTTSSVQFVAVSQSDNPMGSYTVFAIDTTDAANPLGDCPCFGDFDQIGADANGFYIATNEFSINNLYPAVSYNGSVIYAISKQRLANAADGGKLPTIARYAITADSFGTSAGGANSGPYHVSPASTPPDGNYANNTEYFVESNSNQLNDNHLIVYAMTGTDALNHGGIPALQATEIVSEGYAFPPDATQKSGPLPYGSANYGATSPTGLQADFNAVQQVTFTNGQLYGAMDTGVGSPTPSTDGIAWFDLNPSSPAHNLSVQVSSQGYVKSSQNLLYPDVVVNGSGQGYVVFSVSGAAEYPSPGYVAFNGQSGPSGNVRLATVGSAPEDGFTCYPAPAAGYPPGGGCRWGDYSGGAEWNGQFFLMAEYIPPSPRDTYVNWGTFVWSPSSH